MPRARNADTFDVWGKPPPLLRTLTERQERALKRYVDKVARKVYRIAYDCGVAAVTPETTQEQIEAAARAIWQTLFPHLPYQTGCSAAAQAALKAAAALTPDKQRNELGYVPKDDPRLNTIIGPPHSPEKRLEE